jgi:hypothetical protein
MTKTVGEHWVCATLVRHNWTTALTVTASRERTSLLLEPTLPIVRQSRSKSKTGSRTTWLPGGVTQFVATSEHEWFILVLLQEFLRTPSEVSVLLRD